MSMLTSIALLCLITSSAQAKLIGILGGNFTTWDTLISNSGNTAVSLTNASSAADLAALDQVWLIRTPGNTNLANYVLNGGLLITEWTGSIWALNDAGLLDATDDVNVFGNGTNDPVSFTTAGIGLGLGASTGNPFANGGATQVFRTFSGLGTGVDVVATAEDSGGSTQDVGIAGAAGNGYVVALGWDWQDTSDGNATDAANQLWVNDLVNITGTTVDLPEPATLGLFGLALLAMRRLRRTK